MYYLLFCPNTTDKIILLLIPYIGKLKDHSFQKRFIVVSALNPCRVETHSHNSSENQVYKSQP